MTILSESTTKAAPSEMLTRKVALRKEGKKEGRSESYETILPSTTVSRRFILLPLSERKSQIGTGSKVLVGEDIEHRGCATLSKVL